MQANLPDRQPENPGQKYVPMSTPNWDGSLPMNSKVATPPIQVRNATAGSAYAAITFDRTSYTGWCCRQGCFGPFFIFCQSRLTIILHRATGYIYNAYPSGDGETRDKDATLSFGKNMLHIYSETCHLRPLSFTTTCHLVPRCGRKLQVPLYNDIYQV